MTPSADSTTPHKPTKRRDGFAAASALAATTILLFAGATTWWFAFRATDHARRAHAVTQAELAARAGLRLTVGALVVPRDLPLGARRFVRSFGLAPNVSSRVEVERVGREWFLVRAEGGQTLPAARRSLGYAVWALHPTARLSATSAVVALGGSAHADAASRIRTDSLHAPPPGWARACASVVNAADSAFPGGILPATGVDTTGAVRLGRLDAAWLIAAADHQVGGVVTPAPQEVLGTCQAGVANNWGDPSGSGACSTYRPIIASRSDLVIRGGVGQGILIIEGDLTLEAGALFRGLVLVSGSLRLNTGSQIAGLARVGGNASLTSSAIQGSSCAALLALTHPTLAVSQAVLGGWINPL